MTAELAVALPAVLLVLAACLGGLRVGAEQVRVVDAAAQAARAAAVGESPRAPTGARLAGVRREGETVCATVREDVRVLGIPLPVQATSCALAGVAP